MARWRMICQRNGSAVPFSPAGAGRLNMNRGVGLPLTDREPIEVRHALSNLAERVGFEPTLEFPLNTLSKRAPSTTRPSLRMCSEPLNSR